ncbi:MAG: flagellar motor protein MotB [Alphaproteobacteria bacterium]
MAAAPPPIKQSDASEDDWLITYADAITLLMAFFVIMFSISEPNTAKFEEVTKGMVETLSRQEVQSPFADLRKDLNSVAAESGEQAQVDTTSRGLTFQFQSGKMFAPGSAEILPEAFPLLDRVAQNLTLFGNTNYNVIVEGHTDDVPINTATFPSNWELSSARAAAVVRYFLSRNLDPKRFRAVGLADTEWPRNAPLVNRSTGEPIPENREANRRVVVKIER